MKRFILLTFGFMGWAFYEMSGGSEFESASDRMARLNPAPEVVVAEVAPAVETQVADAPSEVIDTDPPATDTVTRVSLNLTSIQDAADQATQAVAPTPAVSNLDPDTGVAVNTDTTTASADTPAIIPSLIAPNDTGVVTQVASFTDVRTVSGNRVNVRGGPGTDYSVVSRLVRGDAVEIIEDNGNGWVLMRPVEGGTQGWMADFLLTSG